MVEEATDYTSFLESKRLIVPSAGKDVEESALHPALFPFQRSLIRWSLRKGRSALFASTGLGKTFCSLEWARLIADRVLILAPLAVALQTVGEGQRWGIPVTYARNESESPTSGITITNYERLERFRPDDYEAVVLDESSILRDFNGKTRTALIEAFRRTPYRLCCTATPAPNDIAEIANHAEMLGVMSRVEMLAAFFVHDDCFVGDTLVDTPGGTRAIADIRVGDRVLNASGEDEVIDTKTRELDTLVEVSYSAASVFCSPSHPWLTTRGWIPAGLLKEGDQLVTQRAALRMVREVVHGSPAEGSAEGTFLQSLLLGEMADEPSRVYREYGYRGETEETLRSDDGILRFRDGGSRSAQRAGATVQAIASAGSRSQDQRDHERAGIAATVAAKGSVAFGCPRRKWSRTHEAAGDAFRPSGERMGAGSHNLMGEASARSAQLLSCGSAPRPLAADSRDRRAITQEARSAGARPAQGRLADFARVDGIKIHQSGSAAFQRYSCGKDTVTLYDLTVKNHPSFSIAGALVHNCGWRLKGHARVPFYRWLASWGMSLTKPSDLGHSDDGYDLPRLSILPHFVETDYAPPGQLFTLGLKGIGERAAVRRDTIDCRIDRAVELMTSEPNRSWIAWVGLDEEGRQLAKRLPGSLLVEGSQSPETKAEALTSFARGETKTLVTKARIAGLGLNLQVCARMVFVGLSDSYEAYYQAIRRCWRFGQTQPVTAHIVLTEPESVVYENVLRKEREAEEMRRELIGHVSEFERAEIAAVGIAESEYRPSRPMRIPGWLRSEQNASCQSGVR